MDEYVDIDSSIQLMDTKSNKLYIKCENKENKIILMERLRQGKIYFKIFQKL